MESLEPLQEQVEFIIFIGRLLLFTATIPGMRPSLFIRQVGVILAGKLDFHHPSGNLVGSLDLIRLDE